MRYRTRLRALIFTVFFGVSAVLAGSGCASSPPLPESDETSESATTASASTANSADELSPAERLQALLKKAGTRHPNGDDLFQLRVALFGSKTAPPPSSLSHCDIDYQTERSLARTTSDLFQTFPAHVRGSPELYHWCFYYKLMELQEEADRFEYVDQTQKFVLERYEFITYLARIFEADLSDERYLANAQIVYRKLRQKYFGGPP